MPLAFLVDEYRLSPIQLPDILYLHVHHGLYNRTLGSQHDNLIIRIIEGRTDSPRVPHAERLATTGDTANHETTIPARGTAFQHVRQINLILDGMRDIHPSQSFRLTLLVQALHFPVQPVSQLLQHDIRIGIFPGMLTDRRDLLEYFMNICQVEISANGKVLCTPVIAS